MEDKYNGDIGSVELRTISKGFPTSRSLFKPSTEPKTFQARESKEIVDETATISDAFSVEVLNLLKEINNLILNSNGSYLLWKINFDKIADSIEELGEGELTSKAKKDIRDFFTKGFLRNLNQYIKKFNNDYRPWGSYDFEKILRKLALTLSDIPLWRKQAEYIIYELKNISKFLDVANERYVPGQVYDYLFLANFDEISKLLQMVRVADLTVKYVEKIKQLRDEILLKLERYKKFNFTIYKNVFQSIDNLSKVVKEKENKKKPCKEPTETLSSSFRGILNDLLVSQKLKNGRSPLMEIIQALSKIHNQIEAPGFNKKIDDAELVSEFKKIKSSLAKLPVKDGESINPFLQKIRIAITDKEFEKFYSSPMAEIFYNLECRCAKYEESETGGISKLEPQYESDNENISDEDEEEFFEEHRVETP